MSLPPPKSDFKRLASVGVLLRATETVYQFFFPTEILKCRTE